MTESSRYQDILSPFARLAGIKITRCDKGYSQCVIEISDQTLNLHRTAHGGAISTLVDCGMYYALHPLINEDEAVRTVQLQVNYFAMASSGVLVCESKIVNKGKRIATLESQVTNEGTLVAKATGIIYVSKVKED